MIFRFRRISILVLIFYSLLFNGCRQPVGTVDTTGGNPNNDYYAIIPDTTKQVDSTTEDSLASISADKSILTFNYSTEQLEDLESGDVLSLGVSTLTPEGLLRKVLSVENSGGNVIITTKQATLEDAIEEGHIGFTETLGSGELIPRVLSPGLRLITSPERVTARTLNLDLINREIVPGVVVNGEISFDMDLEFVLDIDFFTLEQCKFIIHTDYDSDLQFDITTDADLDEVMLEVGTLSFPPIIIPAGIKLIFIPELSLNVGIDGDVTAGITSRVMQTAELDAGLEYDGNWNKVKDFTYSFQFDTPEMEGAASMKGLIGPELSIKLYDVVGPYVNAYGYLKLDAAMVNSEPWWELHGGLEMGAGVEIEILSENASIAECEFLKIIEYDRLLATGTGTQNHNWTLQTIDQYTVDNDYDGFASDIVVDSAGGIHIVYGYDSSEYGTDIQLKYAHFDGQVWELELVDSAINSLALPGIAVGSDGTVYIAYERNPNYPFPSIVDELTLAVRTGAGWSIETIDSDNPWTNDWNRVSLVLDASGSPHVAYAAFTDLGTHPLVKYAYRNGTGWHCEVINPGEADKGLCQSPVLKLTSSGWPRIAYRDNDLWYAYKNETGWHLEAAGMNDNNNINTRVDLDLDINGKPYIAYWRYNYDDYYWDVRYRYKTAETWVDEFVTNAEDSFGYLSFALDSSGIPHFIYHDRYIGTLLHAVWQGSGWAVGAIDQTSSDTGWYNSIYIDGNTSYVTYYDEENDRLRLAVWSGD